PDGPQRLDDDRASLDAERGDRGEHDRVQAGVYDRPEGTQGVGGRTGRAREDEAVGPDMTCHMAIERNLEEPHLPDLGRVQYEVVGRIRHGRVPDQRGELHALFEEVESLQQAFDRPLELVRSARLDL